MPIKEMHNDIEKVINRFLDSCIPTEREINHLNKIAFSIKNQIKNFILNDKKYSIMSEVVFGGSFAKGTWLKNEADIDIFVKFNNQTSLEDLENIFVNDEKLQKKFDSFLIILDPIDSNRNLGTAISSLSAGTLIQSSRVFLKNPTNDFFIEIQKAGLVDQSIINQFSSNILIVEFKFSFRTIYII